MNPTRIPLQASPTVLSTSDQTMYTGRSCTYNVRSNNIILPTGAQGISLTVYINFTGLQEASYL